MLMLSRKRGERILFPALGISVNVVRVDGNTVRLGIEAPKDIQILREEVQQRMERDRLQNTGDKHEHD